MLNLWKAALMLGLTNLISSLPKFESPAAGDGKQAFFVYQKIMLFETADKCLILCKSEGHWLNMSGVVNPHVDKGEFVYWNK